MKTHIIWLVLFVSSSGGSRPADIEKLKNNWIKFLEDTIKSAIPCYKSVADYGIIKVATNSSKCDITVDDTQRHVCIKLNSTIVRNKMPMCYAVVKGTSITITLIDVNTFCEDRLTALHMLLHSTSPWAGHGLALPRTKSVSRHAFVDPLAAVRWRDGRRLFYQDDLTRAEYRVHEVPHLTNVDDWDTRSGGGVLLLDPRLAPSRLGNKMLVSAADPRYQASMLVQWMGGTEPAPLSGADLMFLSYTTCRKQRDTCGKPCRGHLDLSCKCHQDDFPSLPCTDSSPAATACDPTAGSRDLCPYGAVVGADLDPSHRPDCSYVTGVANGLSSVHTDVKRFLEAATYPWPYFMMTLLPCPGQGRITDITVGFPEASRKQLLDGQLPADREVLCDALRVYIPNAEAQRRDSHSLLTHEIFCLDDLVLAPLVHLPRPRRPAPASGALRDAVYLWLGPKPKGVDLDLGKLVVKFYAVKASSHVITPYAKLADLTMEMVTPGTKCMVEVNEDESVGTTAADFSTTISSVNFSTGAEMRADQLLAANTGSALGLLLLLALFAYCMFQRTVSSDWESDSSWSQSPGSWTTSSTSSWTTTPLSSDDLYSSDSFDFERDAHLVRNRKTLNYMKKVQEEALVRRLAERLPPDD